MPNPLKALDQHVGIALNHYAGLLETHFECDAIAYVGSIHPFFLSQYLETIEAIQNHPDKANQKYPKRLVIVLTTGGGIVEAVEKMVEITRHFYEEVFFIVPDSAMSAGTIWCMSGDKIYMDYASSLGPIDPQVATTDGRFVPALGYLDKVNELIKKSTGEGNRLSEAEFLMLKNLDLGMLRRYEQAKDLSVSLLKKWLVDFKFKNWNVHKATNPGVPVTPEERVARAEEIANCLSDNNRWHSHGRMIGMKTLQDDEIKLEIDDYSTLEPLRTNIRMYSGLLSDYLEKQGIQVMIHNRRI